MTETVFTSRKAHHQISDIVVVYTRVEYQKVNLKGEAIGQLAQTTETETRGWVCQKCDVLFQKWAAVAKHLEEMRRREAPDNPTGHVRNRARVFSEEQITDIIRFTRDVLGIKISEPQARAAAIAMRQADRNLVISSRRTPSLATRIAAGYQEFNNYGQN